MLPCRFFEFDKSGRIVGFHEQQCADADDIHAAATSMLAAGNRQVHCVEAWIGGLKILALQREGTEGRNS